MQIIVDKLYPSFLEKEKIVGSQCWNQRMEFNAGEKIHFIAPSGRGKTSLINFLYSIRQDYDGQILYNKKNIKSKTADELALLRSNSVSIIFQDLKLFPNHTVSENLEVKRKLNPYHSHQRMEEMTEQLGISSKLSKPVSTCSYGEQQRVAIIRALQQPFDWLLMDEPFSHLDESNRQKAMALIAEESAKRNAGILLADLKQRDYFNADKIIVL